MKLLKVTTAYPEYLNKFYAQNPDLANKSYAEQKQAMDYDGFGWLWTDALAECGYDMQQITLNAEPLQRAWARENQLSDTADPMEIGFAQVKKIQPDIVWFDNYTESLLQRIRDEVKSVKLVLGWTGSAVPQTKVWGMMDLVLSCAPEAVERLRKQGHRAEHLHHGFDPGINNRLKNNGELFDLSFVGQLVRGNEYHLFREHVLEQVSSYMNVHIYTPITQVSFRDDLKYRIRAGVYDVMNSLKGMGIPQSFLERIPKLGKALKWEDRPQHPVNPVLKPLMKPPVFGLEMFQVLKDSKATLNVHADSSPEFASNMRLWEATGVGTCLVTDWKANMHELFEPDKEVVTYKSIEECVEKIKWLLEHPDERRAIAKAGQARTLREHTFHHRAKWLDEIIRRELKNSINNRPGR